MFETYKGRRVLVTGHTGFKGAWLCLWLRKLGADVTGVALAPSAERPSLFGEAGLAGRVASQFADIRDLDAMKAVMAQARPEIVFHLAAQALVSESYRDPSGTFATNVVGTVNVLEAARACPSVKAVVCVTSDKVYLNHETPTPYREGDELGGRDPYSASKAAAEIAAALYRDNQFQIEPKIAMATARGGNVIGGGDWAVDRLVPDIVGFLSRGEPVVLRNPSAVRPWQHVLELCRGYLLLGERLSQGSAVGAWNFGPGPAGEAPVSAVVETMLAAWDNTDHPVQVIPTPFKESKFLRLDVSKAGAELGWRPALDLSQSIRMSVSWYKRWLADRALAARLTEEQIDEYSARF